MEKNRIKESMEENYRFDEIKRIYHGTVRCKEQVFLQEDAAPLGGVICDSYFSGESLQGLNKNPILTITDPTTPAICHVVVIIVHPTNLDHEDQVFGYFSQCFPQFQFEKFFRQGIDSKSARAKTAIGGPLRILFPTKEAYTSYKGTFICAFFEVSILHALTRVIAANKSYGFFCKETPAFFSHQRDDRKSPVSSMEAKFDILLDVLRTHFPDLRETFRKRFDLEPDYAANPMDSVESIKSPTSPKNNHSTPKGAVSHSSVIPTPTGERESGGTSQPQGGYEYTVMPPRMVDIFFEGFRKRATFSEIVTKLNTERWQFLDGKESTLSSLKQLRRKQDYSHIRDIVKAEISTSKDKAI